MVHSNPFYRFFFLALLFLVLRLGVHGQGNAVAGHGAWIFTSPSNTVAHLEQYHRNVPRGGVSITHLFVHAGRLTLSGNNLSGQITLTNVLETAQAVEASRVVLARVGVSAELLNGQPSWSKVASSIVRPIQEYPEVKGLLIDVEAMGPGLVPLLQAVGNTVTNRLVAVAVPETEVALAEQVDLYIFKAYKLAAKPRMFRRLLNPKMRAFARLTQNVSTPCLIAVPAVATEMEFETRIPEGGIKERSNYQMMDYVRSTLRHIEQACRDFGPSYQGLAIWAYFPEDQYTHPASSAILTPGQPDTKMYRLINLPPCR